MLFTDARNRICIVLFRPLWRIGPHAIALRSDFSAPDLRRLARRGNVTLRIVRDWVAGFNTEGPDGLRDRRAPGQTPRLTDAHRQALAAQIGRGPIPAVHGVVRRRASRASRASAATR